MFIFKNNTFHVTRGDSGSITIAYKDGSNLPHSTLTFGVYRKNELDSDPVIWVEEDLPGDTNSITLDIYANPDKIENPDGDKEEYWYELKLGLLNTVLGYDETGAKLFYLYPSGKAGVEE